MLSYLLQITGVYRAYEKFLKGQIQSGEKPQHIGIILDGNRRWAKSTHNPRWVGHFIGAGKAEELMDWCNEIGVKTATLYILSTENYERNKSEMDELFNLIDERLSKLLVDERIHRNRINVKAIGQKELLPKNINTLLSRIEKDTEDYSNHFLNIAIAYGGRHEIVDVMKIIAEKAKSGELNPSEITTKMVEQHLYTSHLPNPEPDLVIRTSGEERLSGFLLWQSAYSELVFLDVYWPEFRKIDLMRAIRTYQKRSKRLGK